MKKYTVEDIVKSITIYDNGGKTLDRYSVILNNYRRRQYPWGGVWLYECLSLSEGGRGFSQFCEAMKGRHLGKIVEFSTLDEETQSHIIARLA